MPLRFLQRNLQKRSIRYIFAALFLIGTFAWLERDKSEIARENTKAVFNRIRNYAGESFDIEQLEDDFNFPDPQSAIAPKLHAHRHNKLHEQGRSTHNLASHIFRDDGLLEVNSFGRHPIYDLISRAEKSWDDKVRRQSTTLSEAVREYKKRYQRDPPMGFKDWYAETR